jgi:acetyl-CoA carboxylase carboxyltransferase component
MPKSLDKLKQLRDLRAAADAGGGPERVAKIHESGRLTARERIHLLFDPGTFQELGVFVTHRSTDPGIADRKYLGDGAWCVDTDPWAAVSRTRSRKISPCSAVP